MHTKKQQVVLIVDDDESIRETIKTVVTNAGYRVFESKDGFSALELIRVNTIDLVLLDAILPGLDGITVCHTIRRNHQLLPIIMLTDLHDIEVVERSFNSGATDFLAKPFVPHQVLQRISFALHNREIQVKLRQKQRQLLHAQKTARLSYWNYDPRKKLVSLSEDIFEYLGKKTIFQMSLLEFVGLFAAEHRFLIEQQIKSTLKYGSTEVEDIHYVSPQGQNKVFKQTTEYITDGSSNGLVFGTLQDITLETNTENLIYFHKYFDQLTGLPNHAQLAKRMAELHTAYKNQDTRGAVLYLSINNLKKLNLLRGQQATDLIIKTAADRLATLKTDNIQVYRLHGNAFVILIAKENFVGEIDFIAHQSKDLVSLEPFNIEHESLHVTASVGISLMSKLTSEPEITLRQAATAMTRLSKHKSDDVYYYDDAIGAHYARRLTLEKELKHAVNNELIEVYFQPQLDCSSGKVKGAEALVRWTTSDGEEIKPEEFIAIAEESNLIIPLGRLVIEKVCEQLQSLHFAGFSNIRLGINLSAKQLFLDNLEEFLIVITNRYAIDRGSIDLEVTESLIMDNYDVCINTLHKLSKLGFGISIDDFGIGHSSLNRLSKMPVSTLKIDKSFVGNIASCEKSANIASAIVALANSLHLHIIAEGVEDVRQLNELKKINVEEVQGWYFSKALNAKDFNAYVSEMNSNYCF